MSRATRPGGRKPATKRARARATTGAMRPRGRPTTYAPEIGAAFFTLLVEGSSLRKICGHPGMPSKSTVMRWLDAYPDFRDQYARAREAQADFLAEEALEEAVHVARSADVPGARLAFDARRWFLSKVAPKRYGDRTEISVVPPPLTAEQMIAAYKATHHER